MAGVLLLWVRMVWLDLEEAHRLCSKLRGQDGGGGGLGGRGGPRGDWEGSEAGSSALPSLLLSGRPALAIPFE